MTTKKLDRIKVTGFRSLRDITLDLTPVTVLIGPNGAGKSNLLTALRMVPLMRTQSLRRFVGEQGGASAMLHYGPSKTREVSVELAFSEGDLQDGYAARLGYAAGDTFIFLEETASSLPSGKALSVVSLGPGHAESLLAERAAEPGQAVAKTVNSLVGRLGFFHFHDTSPSSPLRQNSRQADAKYLRSDGSNLASFLYKLRTSQADGVVQSWNLINGLVRRVAPFIKSLDPDLIDPAQPDTSALRLYWTDERDHRFDPHDLSDGALRAIGLIAALAQPHASLPSFITIDEPELGLHPAAISLLASLVRSVSNRCQVILSTQSPALLDEFAPEEVVVVERNQGESTFRRLDPVALDVWLDEYSLSQLYNKNVLGGRP